MARRSLTRATHRLHSLPILALSVHSACNCRCIMCDIWKANAERREISAEELTRHLDAMRRLKVRRVMLTGGEPLMHSNLRALCEALKARGIRLTIVTTGLLLGLRAADLARWADEIVVSIDGSRDVHDHVRRVRGAYDRIASGIAGVRSLAPDLPISGRAVVQKMNYLDLPNIVGAAHELGLNRISFLAADVSSEAFNRPIPWDSARQREVMLDRDDLPKFAETIERTIRERSDDFGSGFIAETPDGLRRLHQYYAALVGAGEFPRNRCNAPWVSAVVEPDGHVRPCFFHPPYGSLRGRGLEAVLNAPEAVLFRRTLEVSENPTCRRCVCTLKLPLTSSS